MIHRSDIPPSVRAVLNKLPGLAGHEAEAPMLPQECYTSAEFFDFEQKHVFSRSWIGVGRVEQIPKPGDYLAPLVAGERLLVVRNANGGIHALSAVCRHRGQLLAIEAGSAGASRSLQCPLHHWTYSLDGELLGAPRVPRETLECLRREAKLPHVRTEIWHGFIFVNLDPDAAPLAPSLAKLEPFWEGYNDADLVPVPPAPADKAVPWNWKIHAENFTDAYHPEFVHIKTHDFAPSVLANGGVTFTSMGHDDNTIIRSVPLLETDGGMMEEGWGLPPAFPPISTLSTEQRNRLTFAMLPPSMTLMFTPGNIAYQIITPVGADATLASNDRVTAGGWLLPRSTVDLPDFKERTERVREGAKKIWYQDIPVNLGVQAGKRSRFMDENRYMPLERTLVQFNAWLLRAYRTAWAAASE
jgi:phenylpropionate dioxygenase-like ring-hydroxylating dioxygenase large terminal subunit